ncbi:MAG: alpha-N-arabinofuranosidase [Candidatus Marinimicrobia bacterium]|nr:alpha-N-arabinofuranosidase [Candidatus Neomarinimicrobiota bacterium]MCF7830282.1 alpha-N-arabinofuranosidase [Candidatus Neomarinimicrobiota bacterium]MCF7882191.1 alpha-N-arabinofuranosidase [Candidatus Neomarinimicrobiota bacterium]
MAFPAFINAQLETDKNTGEPGVAVLMVDTDRVMSEVDEDIYGHFLEHINHSVVDGLFAEQVRGRGFEADDFTTYWEPIEGKGDVEVATGLFKNGEQAIRFIVDDETAGIGQGRFYLEEGYDYNGSVWLKPESGEVQVTYRVKDSRGNAVAEVPLNVSGSEWQEAEYSFASDITDEQAQVEVVARGSGSILVDYISMMRADIREDGMLRPDLVESLKGLEPTFLRWPGGSFASIYKWKDGIGPHVSRSYNPNAIWGDYSDYYGFGTEEFMELCKKLETDPMVVLPATTTDPEAVQYAMDWVRYMLDPAETKWGKMRAENGHPEPYDVPYIQIDNEPMNHGLSPEEYAEIVNVYGSQLREILAELSPDTRIVACGQKRSNDMIWSERVIDIAGENFDILGCHNYEYEPENFKTGVRRIENYLTKLREYVRNSDHPDIKIGVLEWNLSRTYDWRAGLHAAGSLISYEELSPIVEMSCPALLMRNTSDDPTWTAFIYHDHVSWFPGSGYVVEKLFREHYAPLHYSSTSGTFRNLDENSIYLDRIHQHKPEDWMPGTVDAIATGTEDGKRIVIKAVNYEPNANTLISRLEGARVPEDATVNVYTITDELHAKNSLENPTRLDPVKSTIPYSSDLSIDMEPYSVKLVEVIAQ